MFIKNPKGHLSENTSPFKRGGAPTTTKYRKPTPGGPFTSAGGTSVWTRLTTVTFTTAAAVMALLAPSVSPAPFAASKTKEHQNQASQNYFEERPLSQAHKNDTDNLFPFRPDFGYIPIMKDPGNEFFYWHFKSKSKSPQNDPVLIWLQGGPGCASETGLFRELGPFKIDQKTGKVLERAESWNQNANLVFLDQPLGTGFSTVTTGHVALDHQTVQKQFLLFYENFLNKYPEYRGRKVYVTGESYGGHWIPYASYALMQSNNPDIDFGGMIIGNGMINGRTKYASLASFSYKNRKWTKFTEEDFQNFSRFGRLCVHLGNREPNWLYYVTPKEVCNQYFSDMVEKATANYPKFDEYYMPGFDEKSRFAEFLNREDVKKYLGVTKKFVDCNETFGPIFSRQDYFVDARQFIVPILKNGYKVWVFDGDLDFTCNYQQEEETLRNMVWDGQIAWNRKNLEDCEYGLCKVVKNLRYIRFAGAGHMVPIFHPTKALEMINEFLRWNWRESD